MKKLKSILSVILAVAMLASLGVTTLAADGEYADVSKGDRYYDQVMLASKAGIMVGKDETHFAPDDYVTRAEMAAILWRLEGEPGGCTCDFADVDASAWYYPAVAWLKVFGMASGIGGNLFAPEQTLTREQMAAMLYRYASHKFVIWVTPINLQNYSDGKTVSSYAEDAVKWMIMYNALQPDGSKIRPAESATRAEVAAGVSVFLKEDGRLVHTGGKSAYDLAVEN